MRFRKTKELGTFSTNDTLTVSGFPELPYRLGARNVIGALREILRRAQGMVTAPSAESKVCFRILCSTFEYLGYHPAHCSYEIFLRIHEGKEFSYRSNGWR